MFVIKISLLNDDGHPKKVFVISLYKNLDHFQTKTMQDMILFKELPNWMSAV